ncbi:MULTISPECIES: TonB-dependent receptor domain-containing protein [unclassified Pedobacter]|uniref:TonB-dependent receptor domain-containing protein n=1 Tax=unclassified Pedobacter TaxID=2628915 RepID=UPI000B4B8C4B|nr:MULTISPECIES: TonB-dependent receptor [unclassified Pedobacter]MCX2433109.1 TonB-dependent receptor [Pedobacter sp. GR22-10]MCX2586114.1 TonB-dependent receptor [Pedobacter sp. MR22-3]OWK69473.1 TonB-dependent receptor [Pedobacter sp. AJM]
MRLIHLRAIPLALLFLSLTFNLFAQSGGKAKITGVLKDAKTQETIPFATAVLIDKATAKNVKIAQTDLNGAFTMADLPNGNFTFKISFVGYQTMVRDNVAITAATGTLNFGDIKMNAAKGNILSEVTVTGQKQGMQMGIDKKIFSVDQSVISEGGSATDLLQNVPSVSTDMDGNVSLRGSTGVRVLIDGKPSLIAGGNVAQILASIPASSIESVEVITNPSAKYDAEGQSGIINIVLKKNTKLGFNGSAAITAGNRDNYNANTNLSFQNSKVNIYGNYSYRYGNRLGGGYQDIFYKSDSSRTAYTSQATRSNSLDKGHNAKAGLDYYLTPKSVISLSGGFNSRENERNELLDIKQLNRAQTPLSLSNRTNLNDGYGSSYDLNLDFVQKFKKPKQELTFNFGYSNGDNNNDQTYSTTTTNRNNIPINENLSLQRVFNRGDNSNYNIQTDYTMPVGKAGKLEAGYRSQIRLAGNNQYADSILTNTSIYIQNNKLINNFDSKDQVHALYLNYQNQIKDFGYQLGLRAEDARLDTHLDGYTNNILTSNEGNIHYKRLYPSVFLTQKLKGDNQVQLSYTRRVNRPRPWDTNPFLDVSDPFNYRGGNPNLLPEDVHSFELGYSKYWKKVTLTSSLYFRQTNDVIQRVRSSPVNGIITTTPQNLSRQINSGLELIGRFDLVKALNFTTNVNLYQAKFAGDTRFDIPTSSGFSWNANLTANLTVVKNLSVQVRGDYRAPEVMAQGKRNAMYGIDGGAKYDFPNKKASLSFNVRDVFNTRRWSMTTEDKFTIVDFERQMQGTMGNLTFSYRFGKTTFSNVKKQKKDEQQDNRPDEGSF